MLLCKHLQSFSYLIMSLPNLTGLLKGGNPVSSCFSACLVLGPNSLWKAGGLPPLLGDNFMAVVLQGSYLEIKKQMDKLDPLAHPLLQWYGQNGLSLPGSGVAVWCTGRVLDVGPTFS